MGYCVNLRDNNFKFNKEDSEGILKTLKEFASNTSLMWADEHSILRAKNIKECFEEIRYPLIESGDFYKIDYFDGEKLGNEDKIFNSIAKYIEKDTYLEFSGEDGDIFRLVFDGEKCEYKYPEIVWN